MKTYKFTVKVKKAPTDNRNNSKAKAIQIYNYIKNYGHSVNEGYYLPGNRCIETTTYGSNYTDIFVISIDTNDSSKIYFSNYRVIPRPTKYKDTTETTTMVYNIGGKSGQVSFFQLYYLGSSVFDSVGHFVSEGIITYANYTGNSYTSERGITSISIGDDKTPVAVGSYDSNELVEGVKRMISGTNRLLANTLNISLRSIGFTKH